MMYETVASSESSGEVRKKHRIELRFIISININKLWKYAQTLPPKLMPSLFDVKSAQAVSHFRDMHF